MHEPKRIPLTDNPRCKEPKKIPLNHIDSYFVIDCEAWEVYETNSGPPILAKNNENNKQDNQISIQELESDKIS